MEPLTIESFTPEYALFLVSDAHGQEVIKIAKDGFYYFGERIEDAQGVYDKFNEWLTQTLSSNTKPL